jgi:hypothetical protein
MFKKIASLLLAVVFIALTVAPDALACNRRRSRASSNYNGYRYNNYNAYRYNNGSYGYNTYSPYRYNGVASDRYYYQGRNYYQGRRSGIGSTGRALLTVGAPAAIGAGVGALLNGKKGAAVGALLGGGGGAAYYLLRHRSRR